MEEQIPQIQLKIEPSQYGTPTIVGNTGVQNQVYYVVMPNIPDQGNIITAGANTLLQNQNAYYVISPGSTTWNQLNQLPVIQTSAATYADHGTEIHLQDPLQTITYSTANTTDVIQGLNDFATEVVINTEPDQSYDSQPGQSQTPSQTSMAKPSPRECNVCHKLLCNKDSLRRHKKLVHGHDEGGTSELSESGQMKRNAKQCECQFCGRMLCNKDSLRRHIKVVHKDGQSQAPYIKLEAEMSEQELLEEAVRRLDEINTDPDQPQQQMYYHQVPTQETPRSHHPKPARGFTPKTRRKKHPICEVCRKPFYNKATLLRHWSTFHKEMTMGEIQTASVETDASATCNLCHRTFFDMDTLRRHKLVVHRENSSHIHRRNTGKNSAANMNGKSDPCHICGKVLYDKGVLRRHLKTVHKIGDGEANRIARRKYAGNSPKAQKCKLCDKILYDKGVLRRHLKHVHGIENTEHLIPDSQVPTPKSTIHTPAKTFSRTPIVMDRPPPQIPGLDTPVIETPKSGNSAHACEKCEETFANSSNLKRHLVIVHKMQIDNYEAVLRQHTLHSKMPRTCNICGKSIIGRSNLVRHQQNVHKIGVVKADSLDNSNSVQNDNSHALEQNYMMKCEPEEVVPYSSEEQMDQNGGAFVVESETEIATEGHVLSDNGHEMELGGEETGDNKAIMEGIVSHVVFDLNEVEECTAKVKQEGEVDSNDSINNGTETDEPPATTSAPTN